MRDSRDISKLVQKPKNWILIPNETFWGDFGPLWVSLVGGHGVISGVLIFSENHDSCMKNKYSGGGLEE